MTPDVEKKAKTGSKADMDRLNILADMLELQVVDQWAPKIGEVQWMRSVWDDHELQIIKNRILSLVKSL